MYLFYSIIIIYLIQLLLFILFDYYNLFYFISYIFLYFSQKQRWKKGVPAKRELRVMEKNFERTPRSDTVKRVSEERSATDPRDRRCGIPDAPSGPWADTVYSGFYANGIGVRATFASRQTPSEDVDPRLPVVNCYSMPLPLAREPSSMYQASVDCVSPDVPKNYRLFSTSRILYLKMTGLRRFSKCKRRSFSGPRLLTSFEWWAAVTKWLFIFIFFKPVVGSSPGGALCYCIHEMI